ncbi:terminase small subunit [Acidovorax sp. NB1]|uniref:terminase small subunit n=1 Tax=Acidovorax sp. NB1 TaxID=1943571 RepID=UPI0010D4C272|nr:terminase small subunit [Acidovorax sp. NB1]GDY37239.1 hypothetical protein ACINB_31310 [Acidovorax sp. NB1]
MAKPPAGKKPAPPSKKTTTTKPAAPKKAAGSVTPARKAAPAKKAPAARTKPAKVKAQSAPQAEPAPITEPTDSVLTDKQQRFVDEYMVDMNATQAAIRAGYSAHTANEQGSQLLAKLSIQRALNAARLQQQERTQITADGALREAWNIATADTRELVELKTGCCRCCYGEGHKWQRTVGEMNRDREKWVEKGNNPAEFDEQGGIGFNPLRAPHAECPECGGDGHARVVLKDTRNLSAKGAALYAGAKQTQFGIEVKMQDKSAALEKVFKHLGLYEKDNQQKTDPLASLLHRIAAGSGNGFKPVADDPERPASSLPMQPDEPDDGS